MRSERKNRTRVSAFKEFLLGLEQCFLLDQQWTLAAKHQLLVSDSIVQHVSVVFARSPFWIVLPEKTIYDGVT